MTVQPTTQPAAAAPDFLFRQMGGTASMQPATPAAYARAKAARFPSVGHATLVAMALMREGFRVAVNGCVIVDA